MGHVGRDVKFGVGVQVTNPRFIFIGDNTWIDDYVLLLAGPPGEEGRSIRRKKNDHFHWKEGELRIGRNCHIAQQVTLQAHGGLSIGDDAGIASGCRVYSLSHHYRSFDGTRRETVFKFTPRAPASEQALIAGPVVMENATGLGLNSVLLPGASVLAGSWVGVLSVVMGTVPPGVIAAGNPAKPIREKQESDAPVGAPATKDA